MNDTSADPPADGSPAAASPPADPSAAGPPDRLSNNPASPFFDADVLGRGVGIRFKGAEKTNVEEYSLSEGWIRVQAGKTTDRRGQPLTIKLSGPVEAWFRDDEGDGDGAPAAEIGGKADAQEPRGAE